MVHRSSPVMVYTRQTDTIMVNQVTSFGFASSEILVELAEHLHFTTSIKSLFTYQTVSFSTCKIIQSDVNSQIVGQVVLLQSVSLKSMRDFIKVFASYSTYETFGLQEERCQTCNDS